MPARHYLVSPQGAGPIPAAGREYNPGHYYSMGGAVADQVVTMQNTNAAMDAAQAGARKYLKGFHQFYNWKALNPLQDVYCWDGATIAPQSLHGTPGNPVSSLPGGVADPSANLQQALDYAASQGQRVIVIISDKSFAGAKLLPDWLDAAGTTVTPIPAQGIFGMQGRNTAGTNKDLTTGAAGGYTGYRWVPEYVTYFNKLVDALAAQFGSHPGLEGVSTQETGVGFGFNTKAAADTAWHNNTLNDGITPNPQTGTCPYANLADTLYSGVDEANNYVSIFTHMRAAFPNKQTFWGMNFILGAQSSIQTVINSFPPITSGGGGGGVAIVGGTPGVLIANITLATGAPVPNIGDTIIVSGVNPSTYNTTGAIISSVSTGVFGTSVSYSVPVNPSAYVSGGTASYPGSGGNSGPGGGGTVFWGPDMYPEDTNVGKGLNRNVYPFYSSNTQVKKGCRVSNPCYTVVHTAAGKSGNWTMPELYAFAATTPSDGVWQTNPNLGQTMNTGPLGVSYMMWMSAGALNTQAINEIIATKGVPPIP